ncbi:MAG: hypothetical protein ACI4XE_12450, partial [Acutalibacteraceae bacterium]
AKPVADFHRQVVTHAEHTTKKTSPVPFLEQEMFNVLLNLYSVKFRKPLHLQALFLYFIFAYFTQEKEL